MSDEIVVPFSVMPSGLPGAPATGHHRRLIKLWEDLGVLLLPDDDPWAARLTESVSSLPQGPRHLWGRALAVCLGKGAGLRLLRPDAARKVFAARGITVPDGCSALARVVVASNSDVESMASLQPLGIEATTLDLIDQTEAFERATALAHPTAALEMSTEKLWNAVVAPLLRVARRDIHLVDQHAAKWAARCYREGTPAAELGLGRFLARALNHPCTPRVEVLTGEKMESRRFPTAGALVAEIADRVAGKNRRSIAVWIVPNDDWKPRVHYRGIVSDAAFLRIEDGIQTFNGASLSRTAMIDLRRMRDVLPPGPPTPDAKRIAIEEDLSALRAHGYSEDV